MSTIKAWIGRALSFPVMLAVLVVAATYAMVLSFQLDPDFWWHLKTGDWIVYEPGSDHHTRTETGCLLLGLDWEPAPV